MIVFISGPYTSHDPELRKLYVARAKSYSILLWKWGIPNICPHLNSCDLDNIAPYETFLKGYIEIMKRCDAILLVRDWEISNGSRIERETAARENKLIFHNIHEIRQHILSAERRDPTSPSVSPS